MTLIVWYGEKQDGSLIYAESVAERRNLESKGFEMIPLYTRPSKQFNDAKVIYKCMVKDCENHSNEGGFKGDVCLPCYEFITTGKGIYSQMYRNTRPSKQLSDEEIYEIWWKSDIASNYYKDSKEFGIEFARAIIKEMNLGKP